MGSDRERKEREMKKKIWVVLLSCVLMLAAFAGTAEETAYPRESFDPAEQVPVLPLPALENGTLIEIPVDHSITVNIGWNRIYETNFVYARVKIAHASQLRTLMASPITSKNTTPGSNLAKRVNAVIAVNGDFCGGEDRTMGAIIRQGELLRR